MSELPEWMYPPREDGWYAEDLDRVPELPRHTELIDGALIFNMSPQRRWHSKVKTRLARALEDQAPAGLTIDTEMTVRLGPRTRPEPDVVVSTSEISDDATWYDASQILLAIEVVSPESVDRDRKLKPGRYADASIRHFWRIEDEDGNPAVHVYELDDATGDYVATGIHRGSLKLSVPFEINIELSALHL
jgi:Uma2 family endonuclease